MRRIIVIIIALIFIFVSCNKTNTKNVKYVATSSISAYNLQYMNDKNELIEVEVWPESAQDQWSYSYLAEEGDIVYISGRYNDINSSLKLMIVVDGKVYKQASNEADTLSYLIVSGTIPY